MEIVKFLISSLTLLTTIVLFYLNQRANKKLKKLQSKLDESFLKFDLLHREKINAIKTLYEKIASAEYYVDIFNNNIESSRQLFFDKLKEMELYYKEKKIFFSPSIIVSMDDLITSLSDYYNYLDTYYYYTKIDKEFKNDSIEDKKANANIKSIAMSAKNKIPKIKTELEELFKKEIT